MSSKVIWTNIGLQKWAGGPQWWPNLGVLKKMKVAQEGILIWFIVLGGSKFGQRPTVVGQRPTTDILNSAEIGCSEEN